MNSYPFLSLSPSPQHNANLLQRSEVVALINTLHRFTESLAAVNDFRKMWAEADPEEEAKLFQEAESTVASASKVGRHVHFVIHVDSLY